MWRPPVLLAPILPAADDPAVTTILEGLCRAGCAHAAHIVIRMPDGPEGTYVSGKPGGAFKVLYLGHPGGMQATVRLFGESVTASLLDSLGPLLEGALMALIERCNASRQVDILGQVLGAATDASLLMDLRGEILWANQRGDELLALHTQQPLACLEGSGQQAPLLHVILDQMAALQKGGDRVRRQIVTTGDGGRWRLEILSVPGLGSLGCCLVILSPVRLPSPGDLATRFEAFQVSHREAEVLALVLRGHKVAEIASQLGLSEYTIKDHLKHAYAKLGINSRGQLLSRIAAASSLGT